MKDKFGCLGAVLAAALIFGTIFCVGFCVEKIPAGYVGVIYKMDGGVQDELLTQGWHIVSPTKRVKRFTVGNEQLVLSKDDREGSEGDERFSVSTADNANIDVSFQMSYRFIEGSVCDTFRNFKGMDGETIVEQRVKTVLKSKISEVTTNYSMMDIYSGNREEINKKLTDSLNNSLGKSYGIEVIDASIIDVHPDEQLKKTIDERVTAMQKKEQAKAEQETIKVQNETDVMKAEAEAKVKLTEANAEAESNKVISSSITPELIQMKEAEARLEHGWVTVQGTGTVVTNGQ